MGKKEKGKKERKIAITPGAIYYPGEILSREQKKLMEEKGVKIKTRSGKSALFFPAFKVHNEKGKLAFVCKFKENTSPVLFVYYVLDEKFVKKSGLLEGFKKLSKENKWKMVDARDLAEAVEQEASQIYKEPR